MIENFAPDFSSLAKSCCGQFHKPTSKPRSLSLAQRHSMGLSRQSISAQTESVKGLCLFISQNPLSPMPCQEAIIIITAKNKITAPPPKRKAKLSHAVQRLSCDV